MTTTWSPPPEARILSGDEPISGTGTLLRDFWAWAYSDLRTNTVRPLLAEYLVARAVGFPPASDEDDYTVQSV